MAAPSYEALGILNLLFLLIGVLILLAVNTYVVWQWRHPEDRNEWFSAKLIVVLSMLASELVIIGLPLDVTNNQGSRDCSWEGGDYAKCGGLDMRGYWVGVSWLQMGCALCLLPGFLFAYEAYDDVDHTTECGSLVKGGLCSVLAILIVFVSVCVPMYLSSEMNAVRRPVVAYTGTLGTVQTYSNTNISSFAAMGDLDEAVTSSSNQVQFYSVDFLDYATRLFSWLGWFLFVLWGGIGLVSLPVDYVLAYIYRPIPLDARELADLRLSVQRRTAELLDLGRQLQGERAAYKEGPKLGWLARRRHEAADQVRVNKLSQMAMILEGDVEELEICSGNAKDYEPLLYVLYLFMGIIAAIHSLLWFLHIAIYILPREPAHPFLNDYLKQFSTWYPLFGSVACAFFALYLLWCTVHGCLKFGTRCFCIKLHPMKRHGTYLNAMLFNTALVGFCSLPVAEFSSHAFADYAAYADASTRFSTLRRLHFFRFWFAPLKKTSGDVMTFAFVALFCVSVLWFFFLPHDVPASAQKLRESLASSVPAKREKEVEMKPMLKAKDLKKRNETRRAGKV
jgi:LMBR1 domain-containing protein 1